MNSLTVAVNAVFLLLSPGLLLLELFLLLAHLVLAFLRLELVARVLFKVLVCEYEDET